VKTPRRQFKSHGEINITPLVDVMLVLLIIFMVTAPMISVNVPIDLPQTNGNTAQETKDSIILSIDSRGKLFLKDQEMLIDTVIDALKGQINERIYIRADKTLSYGNVIDVMGDLSKAGFIQVSLVGESK
jgi:biopolymer transport protein TolR